MLVDDEIDIIGLFTEVLTLNGINVRPFTNPNEALRDFEQLREIHTDEFLNEPTKINELVQIVKKYVG